MRFRINRRRLRAMMVKEFAQIMRDPSTFLIALAMPLLLLFLFGYAVSLDTSGTRIAVVIEDSSAPALGADRNPIAIRPISTSCCPAIARRHDAE